MPEQYKSHSDPVDYLFNVFFGLLWTSPIIVALYYWSLWPLLAYIVVFLIVGL